MPPTIIAALIISVLLLGFVVIPYINKSQFAKLTFEQKVRVLMKEAKGLVYFKNVSQGKSGTLYYVKNKRKIYTYPWTLENGMMHCTRSDLFNKWDYPEDSAAFTEDETKQAVEELIKFNEKNTVKIFLDYEPDE